MHQNDNFKSKIKIQKRKTIQLKFWLKFFCSIRLLCDLINWWLRALNATINFRSGKCGTHTHKQLHLLILVACSPIQSARRTYFSGFFFRCFLSLSFFPSVSLSSSLTDALRSLSLPRCVCAMCVYFVCCFVYRCFWCSAVGWLYSTYLCCVLCRACVFIVGRTVLNDSIHINLE